ncbi:hypothetical protein [Paraburkholderia bannensis]|uniref:hypothetical protein n=1 Tax=Paraburkholderia bannensis TaxID=765414 RepID=UPI0012EB0848|nr:hypothetical protein [Paraburkholderia bannensis]
MKFSIQQIEIDVQSAEEPLRTGISRHPPIFEQHGDCWNFANPAHFFKKFWSVIIRRAAESPALRRYPSRAPLQRATVRPVGWRGRSPQQTQTGRSLNAGNLAGRRHAATSCVTATSEIIEHDCRVRPRP